MGEVTKFLKSNDTLNSTSPRYLTKNKKVIFASILRNINSIKYASLMVLKKLSIEEKKSIVELALKNNYIIEPLTPSFLCSNFELIISSINLNVESIGSCCFNDFNAEQIETITHMIFEKNISYELLPYTLMDRNDFILLAIKKDINIINYITCDLNEITKNKIKRIILESNYSLDYDSPTFLKEDPEILLHVLKYDINAYKYAFNKACTKDVIKYLLANGVKDFYNKFNIEILKDDEILDYIVKGKKMKDFIKKLLKEDIKIANFNLFIDQGLETKWNSHIEDFPNIFYNVWQRIIFAVNECQNFEQLEELLSSEMLLRIYETMPEKKELLQDTIISYYKHSRKNNRQEVALERQEIIDLCNLYLMEQKKQFIKQRKENIIEQYKDNNCLLFQFNVKKDSQAVIKYKEKLQKQKVILLLDKKDQNIEESINHIIEKYPYDSNLIRKIIYKTITSSKLELSDIIREPKHYINYLLSIDLNKLINRLNSKNINILNKSYQKYQKYIAFSEGKYKLVDDLIQNINFEECRNYHKLELLFKHIQRDTMNLIHNIDVEIDYDSLDLEFNDENYYFKIDMDVETFLNYLKKLKIIEIYDQIAEDKLFDLLISQNLFFFLLANNDYAYLCNFGPEIIVNIIKNIDEISKFINNISLNNLNTILLYSNLFEELSLNEISIIKEKYIRNIIKKEEFDNDYAETFKIEVASNYIIKRHMKNTSSIPYVKGSNDYYNYELYDEMDDDILLSGTNTHACFRIGGYDNDFFNYAGISTNGLVIKFTDKEGNFVGRASGFRNGNGIYINQLRSVFDKMSEDALLDNLIDAFDKCCKQIINISKETDTDEKIEFILVTQSYTLENNNLNYPSPSEDFYDYIGHEPMNTKSNELHSFHIENSRYLDDGLLFSTDYGDYALLCVDSSIGKLKNKRQIKEYDAKPIYKRTRNTIQIFDNINNVIGTINQTKAIYCKLNGIQFNLIDENNINKIIIGDNWYIIIREDKIESLVLDFDEDAVKEMEYILQEIKNNLKQDYKVKILKTFQNN